MRLFARLAAAFLLCLYPLSHGGEEPPSPKQLLGNIETLRPLHPDKVAPKPGDWLDAHGDVETGQTFRQYLRSRPIKPGRRRDTIYVQPLGDFTPAQQKVVTLTAEYMALFFNLPVTVRSAMPLSVIPSDAQRVHPEWGMKQLLTTHILNKILLPELPSDAAVFICFTTSDLYPGDKWNFVFGQANTRLRVGVQSMYRNGDPDKPEEFKLCLRRTMKTATHETGHMFSIYHCIRHECNMNGSNSRSESDSQPLYLCPECMAKICWVTRVQPVVRYRRLAAWLYQNDFVAEAEFMNKSVAALGGETVPPPSAVPAKPLLKN